MKYEMAKKLKDAGFPQKDEPLIQQQVGVMFTEPCYVPPLSELIVACGDGVFTLSRNTKGQWFAEKGMLLETITEEAPTPEEAVAMLWLALHTK